MNVIPILLILWIAGFFVINTRSSLSLEKRRKQYAFFFALVCVLFAGLRNVAVGSDTYAYYLHYEDVKNMSWEMVWDQFSNYIQFGIGKDLGYMIVQKVFQVVFSDYKFFMFAVVLCFYASTVSFIHKHTHNMVDQFVALMLLAGLFYQFTYTGLRQVLAFSIVVYSMKYIEAANLKKFLLVLLPAVLLHKSALLFVPCYFVCQFTKAKYIYLLTFALLPILFVLRNVIAVNMALLAQADQYMMYVTGDSEAGTPMFTALIVLIVVAGMYYRKETEMLVPDHYYITNLVLLGLAFTPLTWVDPNLMRVVMYFTIFLPVYFGRIINVIPKNLQMVAIVVAVGMLSLLMMKQAVPYAFFWQSMQLGDNYYR